MIKKRRKRDAWNETGFEAWGGYMPAKISKLKRQFNELADKSETQGGIFKGVSVFVNGYTRPTADEIKRIMMLQGGMYQQYESAMTTHIIASNLPDTKVKNMNTSKVVRPEWITDSLNAGKLLDYKKYLLCPPVPRDQTRLNFAPKQSKEAEFINDFYNNSRLHHISTMGATFKQYVNELREKSNGTFPGRHRLALAMKSVNSCDGTIWVGRIILHIDMDCFFVSVGLRSRKDLVGHPVAVTHSKGNPVKSRPGMDRQKEFDCYKKRAEEAGKKVSWTDGVSDSDSMSEIASCNYEARKAGVKNGMFLGAALKLCPNLKTIPYDFESYKEVSYSLYNTVAEYTLDVEAVSCDEMYVDCTDILNETSASPLEFAAFLRREIAERTDCTASAGLGPNPLIARLATRKAKPNGEYFVAQTEIESFLSDIKVEDLPGVGYSLSGRLHGMGITTCQDLRNFSLTRLKKEFGNKIGERLFKYSRGRDDRPLSLEHQRKSVSAEVNYGIRFETLNETETFLSELSVELEKRLRELNLKGRCLTLKYMVRAKDAPKETAKFMGHGMCDHVTKSYNFVSAVCDAATITKEVLRLNSSLGIPPCDLRGVGLQMTRLESGTAQPDGLDRFLVNKTNNLAPSNVSRKLDMPKKSVPPVTANKNEQNLPKKTAPMFTNNINEQKSRETRSKPTNSTNEEEEIILDEEVLAALPDDIRQEVLAEYKKYIPKSKNQQAKQEKHTENETIVQVQDTRQRKVVRAEDWLEDTVTVYDMCRMIREWVEDEEEPRPWDVNMLAEYLESLAFNKDLDGLYMAAKTLQRCTFKNSCPIWTEAYAAIVERFQAIVSAIYGVPLKL